MRIAILLLAAFITIKAAAADDRQIVKAPLKAATVYRSGAELVHTSRIVLKSGNNDITIEGLSNKIDINSVRLNSDAALTILSIEFATDYLKNGQKSPLVKRLEDSLEVVNKEHNKVNVLIKTDEELIEVLKANKTIGGSQSGLSTAELTKMIDYYRSKTLELQQELLLYREKSAKLEEMSTKLVQQINEESQKNNKTVGKLNLQLMCPLDGTYNLTLSYLTPAAGWVPSYDVRVDNILKPAVLSYKAKLVQTTGLDWQQVKLALATALPSQNNNAPDLRTWFLSYTTPGEALNKALSGKVTGLAVNQLQEVVVVGYGTQIRGNSSFDYKQQEPVYIINGLVKTESDYKKIRPQAIKEVNVLKDQQATAIYGSRAAGGAVIVTLKDELSDYVVVNDNELNVTFDIDLPYDVPGNGKEQQVKLKDFTVPASFKYLTVPKLDKDAYLLCNMTEWEKLNLLPGEANIIFEGTYIGRTTINPGSVSDTLQVTVGRDKRVAVTRQKLVDFSSVKFLGSNKKQVFTYETTIRNNKKEKIQLELRDQIPVSSSKDIEVELLESKEATVNSDTGLLTWNIELAPGETKKIRISYSAKYPKDKLVNL